MRPENLFKLTPELKAAINRHPAANRQTGTGMAVTAAPPRPDPGRGSTGKRDRWRCHQPGCGQTFSVWAQAERHRHENHMGGWVGVIDLVLS